MIQTTIRELKKGDFFTFRPIEEPKARHVYVRSHYDRNSKLFAYYNFSGVNCEQFTNGNRIVYTDFIF